MKKTAHWIGYTHLFRSDEYECSNCGEKVTRPKKICPNSGAPCAAARATLAGWTRWKRLMHFSKIDSVGG